MTRVTRKWLTPDAGAETSAQQCRSFLVPVDLVPFFVGALAPLTEPWKWQQSGSMTPERASEIFAKIIYNMGECEMLLRQNPAQACALERSMDNGQTWQQWADLSLCGTSNVLTRINPQTGAEEQSTDGGQTWQAVPSNQAKSPRFTAKLDGPVTGDKCKAAESVVAIIQQTVDKQLDGFRLFKDSTAIGLEIASIFIFSPEPTSKLLPLIFTLVNAGLTLGQTAFEAAFTSAVWARTQCAVYCAIKNLSNVTPEAYDQIRSKIAQNESGIAQQWVLGGLANLGPVGLQNALGLSLDAKDISSDCSACGCDDVICYFGAFDHVRWSLPDNQYNVAIWTSRGLEATCGNSVCDTIRYNARHDNPGTIKQIEVWGEYVSNRSVNGNPVCTVYAVDPATGNNIVALGSAGLSVEDGLPHTFNLKLTDLTETGDIRLVGYARVAAGGAGGYLIVNKVCITYQGSMEI